MKRAKFPAATTPAPVETDPSFIADLNTVLRPERKWHYLFHLLVVAVALSYWLGSLALQPEASGAEITMYRPKGDNQLYPVITALSRLNLGDPTDAFHHGKGVAGFHAVILLPYAVAVAVFGWPGYMLVDVILGWAYFVCVLLLLRRCNVGGTPGLMVGAGLASGVLQQITNLLGVGLLKFVSAFKVEGSDWGFPNLIALQVFDGRIPRPMITEIPLILTLYFLLRLWRGAAMPEMKTGLAVGALFALVMQGDPFSFSVLGLVLLGTLVRVAAVNGWRWPWRFIAGAGAAGAGVGAYFFFQVAMQEPESAVRFGLASFPRSRLLLLPGYGPILRVAVVAAVAAVVLLAARRARTEQAAAEGVTAGAAAAARFLLVVITAAWLAQPAQVFLLGKGAQLYHYHSSTLPAFYSYAMIILLAQVILLAWPARAETTATNPGRSVRLARRLLLTACFILAFVVALEGPLDRIHTQRTARDEIAPWAQLGDAYRPGFRGLDRAFREVDSLKKARTFATFCHEVNFLLAGFHDKRAYLPDNGFTTLQDAELERRLFEVCKICRMHPDEFSGFIQNMVVMNYWLGCAKYWFAVGQTFSTLDDYAEIYLNQLDRLGRQPAFSLALPRSEAERLTRSYADTVVNDSDVSQYPDVIVVDALILRQGFSPHQDIYREAYTNDVFFVYSKSRTGGVYSAAQARVR